LINRLKKIVRLNALVETSHLGDARKKFDSSHPALFHAAFTDHFVSTFHSHCSHVKI